MVGLVAGDRDDAGHFALLHGSRQPGVVVADVLERYQDVRAGL